MSKEDLQRTLDELRTEILHLHIADAPTKRRVTKLIGALEHQLAHPEDTDHRATLSLELPGLVEHLEAEHPRVTEILNRVSEALSGMGI